MSQPENIFDWNPMELREMFANSRHLDEINAMKILNKLQEILCDEENLLYLNGEVTICGDIHGQLFDLFNLFDTTFPIGIDGENCLQKGEKILFMGDYVDRGYQSVDTFLFLAFLKIKYPQNVFLLRGNHESRQVNQMYGFFSDCQQTYGNTGIWFLFNETFDYLPLAAIVNQDFYCIHGGLSPHVRSILHLSVIKRCVEIPNEGPMADITWSDPRDGGSDRFIPNNRGAGFIFGDVQAEEFCHINDIKLIVRSHQLAEQGFTFNCNNRVLTVWSAPNYAYRSVNDACVMKAPQNWDGDTSIFNADRTPEGSNLRFFEAHENSAVKPADVLIDYFA